MSCGLHKPTCGWLGCGNSAEDKPFLLVSSFSFIYHTFTHSWQVNQRFKDCWHSKISTSAMCIVRAKMEGIGPRGPSGKQFRMDYASGSWIITGFVSPKPREITAR